MSFSLFISRNKKRPDELCPGSTLCSDFLHNIDEAEVEVVDCNRSDFARPSWLKGTPTLYEYETKRVWTGHEAVRRLYHMSLHYAMTASSSATGPSVGTTRQVPRMQPQRPHPRGSSSSAPGPPPPSSRGDDSMDGSIWESQITPDMENGEETETRSDRKMTGDDLQRAMSQRMMTNATSANGDPPQTMNAPPPPPPALTD